uniref:Uncharacterized protein n=1 Tax=Schistosoma curassoni TaxID=6186 RepID=A0A183K0N3_9TREM
MSVTSVNVEQCQSKIILSMINASNFNQCNPINLFSNLFILTFNIFRLMIKFRFMNFLVGILVLVLIVVIVILLVVIGPDNVV